MKHFYNHKYITINTVWSLVIIFPAVYGHHVLHSTIALKPATACGLNNKTNALPTKINKKNYVYTFFKHNSVCIL